MKFIRNIKLVLACICFLSFGDCYASFWDDLWSAITFQTDNPEYYFDGKRIDNTHLVILPPYGRKAGRGGPNDQNCLYQFHLRNDMNLNPTCAQAIPNNDFRNPKIRMKSVICPLVYCFDQQFDLKGVEGECNMFATPELIVAKRVCARIASPAGDGNPADHGYPQTTFTDSKGVVWQRGLHLDTYGVNKLDDLYTDDDGNQYPILRPKMCAYNDPWLLDVWTLAAYGDIDLFDFDPTHQPFHYSQGDLSPIVKIIIFVFQSYVNLASGAVDLVGAIVGAISGSSASGGVADFFKAINFIIEKIASIGIAILKEIGQVNRLASADYGCVDIPLGPYPPRYCQSNQIDPDPLVYEICTNNPDGSVLQSCYLPVSFQNNPTKCSTRPCSLSSTDNNFLNNSLRVAYQNRLPLCSATQTKNCITFRAAISRAAVMANNLGQTTSGVSLNILRNNLIIGSALTLTSNNGFRLDGNKYYRLLYEVKTQIGGSSVSIDNYSYLDLPSCDNDGYVPPSGMGSNQFCQRIWGVDIGDYSDNFSINYTGEQTSFDLKPSSEVSLSYNSITNAGQTVSKSFYSKIDSTNSNQICAYLNEAGGVQISCVPRAPIPKGHTVSYCAASTHLSPCVVINLETKGQNNITYRSWATLTYRPQDEVTSRNIAGVNFKGYVTDDVNSAIPFTFASSSDPRAVKDSKGNIISNSLLGSYKNNSVPQVNCALDTCAKYLSGLEYVLGHYMRGGKYFCVDPDQSTKCPDDPTKCVLANKVLGLGAGGASYAGVSTNPADRVSPGPSSPSLPAGSYFDPNDINGTNCLNKRIKTQVIYSGITECLPECNANTTTSCIKGLVPVDTGTCPITPVYSYDPKGLVSGNTAIATNSTTVTDGNGNTAETKISVNSSGFLVYTKTDTVGGGAPIVSVQTFIKLGSDNAFATVMNVILNDNNVDKTITTATIDPNTGNVTRAAPSTLSGGASLPSLPVNVGTLSTDANTQVVTVVNGTKLVTSDPRSLAITLLDQNNPKIRVIATVDLGTGIISLDKVTTEPSTNVSNTQTIEFDPATGKYSSAASFDDPINGASTKRIVNPVTGVKTEIAKTTTVQGNVTTVSTVTTTTNPSTYTSTTVKVADITTVDNGVSTTVTQTTDANGNVVTSPPRTGTAQSSIYYCYKKLPTSIPVSQGVRSKIGRENDNSCIAIPDPSPCPVVTSNNATWPSATPGAAWVQGTCVSGYQAIDPAKMGRQCLLKSTGVSAYDDIDSSQFAGCRLPCGLSNVSVSSTANGFGGTSGYINGTCSADSCAKGTQFGINVGNRGNAIWGSPAQNTFTIRFTIKALQYISLGFTELAYDDGVKVRVNGREVASYWPSGDTYRVNNYPDLTGLNNSMKSALVEGQNTIEIDLVTYGGGGIVANLLYNNTCPTQ